MENYEEIWSSRYIGFLEMIYSVLINVIESD